MYDLIMKTKSLVWLALRHVRAGGPAHKEASQFSTSSTSIATMKNTVHRIKVSQICMIYLWKQNDWSGWPTHRHVQVNRRTKRACTSQRLFIEKHCHDEKQRP